MADLVAQTVTRLRAGTAGELLDDGCAALVGHLRKAAFRPGKAGELLIDTRLSRALLALHAARYQMLVGLGAVAAFDEAGDLAETAVLTSRGDSQAGAALLTGMLTGGHWQALNDLTTDVFQGWRRSGSAAVLAVAVGLTRSLSAAVPPGDPDAEVVHSNLGAMMATAADATDDGGLLDEAIEWLSLDGPTGRSARLANLADALLKRHDRTRTAVDLDRALEFARRAVETVPPDDHDPGHQRTILGLALLAADRLDEAADELAGALDDTDPDAEQYAGRCSNLGLAYIERFDRTGVPDDLDASIDMGRRALEIAAATDPNRAAMLVNLSSRLLRRHEIRRNPDDLQEALRTATEGTGLKTAGEPERRGALVALALAQERRFRVDGDVADVTAAVDRLEDALATVPAGTDEEARLRSTLGIALRGRFEATGKRHDLDRAIEEATAAVTRTRTGRPEWHRRAGQLAGILQSRFQLTSAVSDARQVISRYDGILAEIGPRHPDRFGYLVNRGLAQLGVWQLLHDSEALHAAVSDLTTALDEPNVAGIADRAAAWSNLSGVLRFAWEAERDPDALAGAVRAAQQAVELLRRPSHLINLSAALQEEFLQTKERATLTDAFHAAEEAARLLTAAHPDLVEALVNVGNTLRLRFDTTAEPRAAAAAVIAYRRAARSRIGITAARLRGARGWGRLEVRRQVVRDRPRWDSARDAYAAAMDLLPQLAWTGLERTDREHLLAAQAGLATEAAAVAITDDRAGTGVAWLEAGRAVLFGQMLAERSHPPQLDRLRAVAPALTDRISANRVALLALPPNGLR
ncbi:MAG: hypothetical protein ABW000_23910 [Actinoplanes sp.]